MAGAKGPGPGMIDYSAQLIKLRQQQRDASLAGDWAKVDEIEAKIKEVERKRMESVTKRGN